MNSEWMQYLLLAVSATSLLLAFIAINYAIRTRKMFEQQARENQQAVETVVEMGKRLVTLQADIQALQHKQQPADLGSNYKAYSQAAELLTRGVSMKEVMERCQLSKGEAELLAAMTQRSKNAK